MFKTTLPIDLGDLLTWSYAQDLQAALRSDGLAVVKAADGHWDAKLPDGRWMRAFFHEKDGLPPEGTSPEEQHVLNAHAMADGLWEDGEWA
jgi:hypothetical protein